MEWVKRKSEEPQAVATAHRNTVQCPTLEWYLSKTAHCLLVCVRQIVFQVRLLYRARLGSVRIVAVCAKNVSPSLLPACKRCRMEVFPGTGTVISGLCPWKRGSDALDSATDILNCQQILSMEFVFWQRTPTKSFLTCERNNRKVAYISGGFDLLLPLRRHFRLNLGSVSSPLCVWN